MGEYQNSEGITKNKIDEAINLLKEQKPKEREDLSDKEAVRKMRRYIEKLTSERYGYTYDEVSEMLKSLGINLTGSRIKYLLGEVRKNTRRHKTQSQGDSPSTNEQIKVEIQPEPKETASEVQLSPVTTAKSKRKNPKSIEASTEP